MKSLRAPILTLLMFLAMLAGEPARALAEWGSGASARQSDRCGCDDDGSCCGGEQNACDRHDSESPDGKEPCPCSPAPVRSVGIVPSVPAVVAESVTASVRRDVGELTSAVPSGPAATISLLGRGRDADAQSVGERLSRWCVWQV